MSSSASVKESLTYEEQVGLHKSGFWSEMRRAFSGVRREETISGYLFLLPNLLGFLAFSLLPILFAFYIMFTDWDLAASPNFVGLKNFDTLYNDRLFWKTLWNTFYYTAFSVPLSIITGVMIALLMNQKFKSIAIFRTIFYLPSVTAGVASSVLWFFIFQPQCNLPKLSDLFHVMELCIS